MFLCTDTGAFAPGGCPGQIWCWPTEQLRRNSGEPHFKGNLMLTAGGDQPIIQSPRGLAEFQPMPFPSMGSLGNQLIVWINYWQREGSILWRFPPRLPSAVQACCLFPARSLISPSQRLARQPPLASVRFMSWSYTWALGSWCALKAMSHGRWKCFTLEQGHTKIMANSSAEEGTGTSAGECVVLSFALSRLMNEVELNNGCWVC